MAIVTATANYPDNLQIELRDVLCFKWGYPELINGQPNPQSKSQFIQERINSKLKEYLKAEYEQGKRDQQTITGIDFT